MATDCRNTESDITTPRAVLQILPWLLESISTLLETRLELYCQNTITLHGVPLVASLYERDYTTLSIISSYESWERYFYLQYCNKT